MKTLKVQILSAVGLDNKHVQDLSSSHSLPIGKLEPYCKIIGGKAEYKTKPVKKSEKESEVKWDETFTFSFANDNVNALTIELIDNPKKKNVIARFTFNLTQFVFSNCYALTEIRLFQGVAMNLTGVVKESQIKLHTTFTAIDFGLSKSISRFV